MAVNYTNLFENLGELVQRVNDFRGYFSDLDTDLSEIESEFEGNGIQNIFSGMYATFDGFKGSLLGWVSEMVSVSTRVLTDRETVLEQLNLRSTDTTAVLRTLYRDMVDNTITINRNTVTLGSVTDDKTNANAGSILVDKVLDGVTSPGSGFPAVWDYAGTNSELGDDDNMFVECTDDSESGSASDGNETFQLAGRVSIPSAFHWNTFGSGVGPTVPVIQGASVMTNCEMESFTSNVPAGWTVDSGSAGTHILEETTTVHRGSSALKFTGNASQASIQVSQSAAAIGLIPRKKYAVGFWVQGNASISAGTLTIQFEGTGYTAGGTEKISLNAAALAALTSYSFQSFHVVMPAEIPSDFKLVIKWTGTPSAHSLFVDGGGVAAPVWHNGVSVIAYAGSDPFLITDRFTFTVANNDAGVFQTFFRKAYGIQLPSSGSPSVADSLAT